MSHDLDQFAGHNPAITPAKGWPFKRIVILTLLIFVVQAALVIILGEKKSPPVRTAVNAPHFQLADDSSGLIALDDPTLFALPHTNNFGASIWLGSPTITTPSFAYTEPLQELPLDSASLAMNLRVFLTTNDNATALPAFKPEPELSAPEPILTAALNGKTTMQIRGELARRPLMPQPELSWITNLPSLTNSDWVDHTHVQVVVNEAGDVVSVLYKGTLLTGAVFERNLDPKNPYVFRLGRGEVIPGWDQIFQMMKPGSTWMVIVPPELAYGSRGRAPRVPPDSTLVFEIQLLKVLREK